MFLMKQGDKVRAKITIVFLFALLGLPSVAMANAGTPLMWMPGIRLVFINILIGVGEGLIISLVFRVFGRKGLGIVKCMGIMILANYFSMLFGEFVLLNWIGTVRTNIMGDQPLYNAPNFIWFMAICTISITIILEWPFCYWTLKGKKFRLVKSLVASPLVHIFSYAFLVWAYLSVSSITIYTELDVERDLSLVKNTKAWIYYISVDDGDVYRIRPDGTSKEFFYDANVKINDSKYGSYPSLFVWPSESDSSWDLWLIDNDIKLLSKGFSKNTVKPKFTAYGSYSEIETIDDVVNKYYAHLFYSDFTAEKEPEWILEGGYWASAGLKATNKETQKSFRVAFETPFLKWNSLNFIYLDGDQIIYQLGEQIVLLDLKQRKIGLITLGVGPVVTLD
jgi:hypothetical protein